MCKGMLLKGDEIRQYYIGTRYTHRAYHINNAEYSGGIGRLIQRVDRFISADADYTGAEFVAPLIGFSGSELSLNVDCSAMGVLWVEITDERSRPIEGYTMSESVSIDRNQTSAPVKWRRKEDLSEVRGKPVRLHFKLRASKLYAFQVAEHRSGV